MRDKLQPAMIAGSAIALLSVIPLLGYGFFFWAIAGGAVASYLYIKRSPAPVQITDGLVLGAVSGIVGSLLYLFIFIPLAYFTLSNRAIHQEIMTVGGYSFSLDPSRPANEWNANRGKILLIAFIMVVVIFVFATVGGVIGVPLFEKRKANSFVPPSSTDPPPAEDLPSSESQPQFNRKSLDPRLIYAAIGLVALSVVGGVVVLLNSNTKDTLPTESQKPSNEASADPQVPKGTWTGQSKSVDRGEIRNASMTIDFDQSASNDGKCVNRGRIISVSANTISIDWPQCGREVVRYSIANGTLSAEGATIAINGSRSIQRTWTLMRR